MPAWTEDQDQAAPPDGVDAGARLRLVTPAAHHFVTSSFANHDDLERLEGEPFLEINPADAADRHILDGDVVLVENRRGACALRAVITDRVGAGVVASPKGYWTSRSNPGLAGRNRGNVNWTTNDALADFAGQSTFHTNDVWVRRVMM